MHPEKKVEGGLQAIDRAYDVRGGALATSFLAETEYTHALPDIRQAVENE